MAASILMITFVAGYYAWALYISHTYPPYHVAAARNWVWDAGLESWLKANYYLPDFIKIAKLLWGVPLLVLAFLGLLFRSAQGGRSNLRWLFHFWLLGGAIFYAFGAQELWENIWNFHIVDPALAGLAAQGLLFSAEVLARVHLPLLGGVAVILAAVAAHGFEMSYAGWIYRAHAQHGYELGGALARISQPSDLVVTVANSIGDPVAIYYSRRRGWVFPPPWPGIDWEEIGNEATAIQLFDRLRLKGATWFVIVAEQRTNFRETAPKLFEHIENTSEKVEEDRDWTVYRLTPSTK